MMTTTAENKKVTAREAYQEAVKINRFLREFENFEAILKGLADLEADSIAFEKEIAKKKDMLKALVKEFDALDVKCVEKEALLVTLTKQGEGIVTQAAAKATALERDSKQRIDRQIESFKAQEKASHVTLETLRQELRELEQSKSQARDALEVLQKERDKVKNLFKDL